MRGSRVLGLGAWMGLEFNEVGSQGLLQDIKRVFYVGTCNN